MKLPEMAVNINGDLGLKDWRDQPPTQNLTLAEKREVAKRANLYPKLIAYLAPRLSNINDGGDEGAAIASIVKAELPETTLWQNLNKLSHRFGYDSPEARMLTEAARIVRKSTEV